MPRTTRAAARAQEDISGTIHLDEDVRNQIQDAVNNFAEISINDVLQEQSHYNPEAKPAKARKGKGTRKGNDKKNKKEASAVDTETSDKENAWSHEEQVSEGEDRSASLNELDHATSSGASSLPLDPSQAANEARHSEEQTARDQDSQSSDANTTQTAEDEATQSEVLNAPSEAVQRLQSLFDEAAADDMSEDAMPQQMRSKQAMADALKASDEVGHATDDVNIGLGKSSGKDKRTLIKSNGPTAKILKTQPSGKTTTVTKSSKPATMESTKKVSPKMANGKAGTARVRSSVLAPTKASAAKESASKEDPARSSEQQVKERSAIAALHTPPRVAKSTKPLTKSTFRLPSEGLAEKMKTQRAERLKRMEEHAQKKVAEIKSRPATATTKTKPMEVKETAASRGRKSMAAVPKDESNGMVNRASTVHARPKSMLVRNARPSGVGSERHARPTLLSAESKESNLAEFSGACQLAVGQVALTPSTLTQPNAGSKESSKRSRADLKTHEQQIKEQAETARKARAEAAERGRQASREWAEKMKTKSAAGAFKRAQAEHAAAAASESDSMGV